MHVHVHVMCMYVVRTVAQQLPCASGTCATTQEAGTRSLYVQYGGPGTYGSAQCTAVALVPLRHSAVRGERAQDARPEQRRPDDAQPVRLHAARLAVELPAVIALQVGDERVREAST